jgi:hypothetical protein
MSGGKPGPPSGINTARLAAVIGESTATANATSNGRRERSKHAPALPTLLALRPRWVDRVTFKIDNTESLGPLLNDVDGHYFLRDSGARITNAVQAQCQIITEPSLPSLLAAPINVALALHRNISHCAP